MSDYSQSVYDAIRSRFYGDFSGIFERVLREIFGGIEFWRTQHEFSNAAIAMQDAHVLMRPEIYIDGDQWCALYGENLQEGVAGFGDSPIAAMVDFDKSWTTKLTARAALAAMKEE